MDLIPCIFDVYYTGVTATEPEEIEKNVKDEEEL